MNLPRLFWLIAKDGDFFALIEASARSHFERFVNNYMRSASNAAGPGIARLDDRPVVKWKIHKEL